MNKFQTVGPFLKKK